MKKQSYCIVSSPSVTTDYDKLWTDFLASDKEYKKTVISLLETDYSNYTYGKKERLNETLALKLNEINFKTFSSTEIKALARDLGIIGFCAIRKQALIEKIEEIRKRFCSNK